MLIIIYFSFVKRNVFVEYFKKLILMGNIAFPNVYCKAEEGKYGYFPMGEVGKNS